jgi:hypothetical protein
MDMGIANAKDKLNVIFDIFCQADGSTTGVRPIPSHFLFLDTHSYLQEYGGKVTGHLPWCCGRIYRREWSQQ